MVQQVVNLENLAEAQEAADAAVEAAKLAAEKVAEVRSEGLTAQQVATLEKPAKAQEANGGMADGYRIIRNGPQDFSVEGVFSQDGMQRFRGPTGFPLRPRPGSGLTISSPLRTDDGPGGGPASADSEFSALGAPWSRCVARASWHRCAQRPVACGSWAQGAG
jgi:hypothetical protein